MNLNSYKATRQHSWGAMDRSYPAYALAPILLEAGLGHKHKVNWCNLGLGGPAPYISRYHHSPKANIFS